MIQGSTEVAGGHIAMTGQEYFYMEFNAVKVS